MFNLIIATDTKHCFVTDQRFDRDTYTVRKKRSTMETT